MFLLLEARHIGNLVALTIKIAGKLVSSVARHARSRSAQTYRNVVQIGSIGAASSVSRSRSRHSQHGGPQRLPPEKHTQWRDALPVHTVGILYR